MNFNPTPGPWTCDENGLVNGMDSRKRFAGSPSHDIFNAREWPTELQFEADDNARLIAAAPDLLAACESLIPLVDTMNGAEYLRLRTRAMEAVIKAKGGSA